MANGKSETVSLYFARNKTDLLVQVDKAAAKDERSRNYVIVQAVEEKFGKPVKK